MGIECVVFNACETEEIGKKLRSTWVFQVASPVEG